MDRARCRAVTVPHPHPERRASGARPTLLAISGRSVTGPSSRRRDMPHYVYVIEARGWKQDRWRLAFRSADKGEARFALWEYMEKNPERPVRVREEDEP